jgi:hypothetical protein
LLLLQVAANYGQLEACVKLVESRAAWHADCNMGSMIPPSVDLLKCCHSAALYHLLHQVAANYGQLEGCVKLVESGAAFSTHIAPCKTCN